MERRVARSHPRPGRARHDGVRARAVAHGGSIASAAAMAATMIDGKAVAQRVRAEVGEGVAEFTQKHGRPPGLATVLVGEDPASAIYVGGKQKATAEVGMRGFDHRLPVDAPREQVVELIEGLN